MPCQIVTETNDIIQAVLDLKDRVAVLIPSVDLPDNQSSLCGDGGGFIYEIYSRVQSFVQEAGSDIEETVAMPDLSPCHTSGFLTGIKAWIDGIVVFASSICDLSLDSAGGDEGFDETFNSGNGGYTLELTYETYRVKDRIILYDNNGSILFDSGCVGTQGEAVENIAVPEGTTSIRVVVEPNCEGGSGTAWYLSVRCI